MSDQKVVVALIREAGRTVRLAMHSWGGTLRLLLIIAALAVMALLAARLVGGGRLPWA